MDDSLKDLESRLEGLIPQGLSDPGRDRCHELIDELAAGQLSGASSISPIGMSWKGTAAAAAVALGLGLGGGLWLGAGDPAPAVGQSVPTSGSLVTAYELIDRESWSVPADPVGVYVASNDGVREIFEQVDVTKEVVRHQESGHVVTIETTDYHTVDIEKNEF